MTSAASPWPGRSWKKSTAIRRAPVWGKPKPLVNDGFSGARRLPWLNGLKFFGGLGLKFAPFFLTIRNAANDCGKATRSVESLRLKSAGPSTAPPMKRAELEHVIRAAGSIADARQLIIIGSQSLLASFPNPPPELAVSMEVDLYPADAPEKADLIDGSIGEKSPFHETFGYYAHGVGPTTAKLPTRWQSRLVPVENPNTNHIAGLCLGVADLVISKLAAGREKDLGFVRGVFTHGLLKPSDAEALLIEMEPAARDLIKPRLLRCAAV